MDELKPSISTGVFGELSPEEKIRRLAKIGWRYLEINFSAGRFGRCEPYKIRKLCEDLGVSVLQVHGSNPGMARKSGEERKKFMDQAKTSLLWAGELGAKWVVLHPSNRKAGSRTPDAFEDVKKRNLEGFRELLETARSAGVGIAVENLPPVLHDSEEGERLFGTEPSELLWLVDNTDPERMGVCLDVNHIFAKCQGFDQYQTIKSLGRHLVATHISDNDGLREQHLLPFMGDIDWKAVVRGLREVEYRGLFNLEVSLNKAPLSVRDDLLRYALKLTEEMIQGHI